MAFKLTKEAQERANHCREWQTTRTNELAQLSDENLIATARLYQSNATPMRYAPGEPVYDATLWHIIFPMLIDRLAARQ